MLRPAIIFYILILSAAVARSQTNLFDASPTPTAAEATSASPTGTPVPSPPQATTIQKRSLFGRILHPFSSSDILPKYENRKLRGLVLSVSVSPQPVRLSEVRQLEVKVTLSNLGTHMINLDFPTDQRVEVQLLNSADTVLTKWSENHAIKETPASILINPGEHIEYKESIATRDLTPGKVFTAEAYFPQYPELKVRQKFMTEP